jgi:PAS domain-containing protein
MNQDVFAPIFHDAPIGMLGVREGKVALANAEAIRFLGASSADEVVGKRLEQVIPVDLRSRASLLPALDRLAPGDIRSFERELALPGAVYAPVTIRATCLEGGMKLLCLLDNAEVKDLKHSLFESEERRRAILDCLDSPLLGIDNDYRIMWASRATAERAGRNPHEMVGRLCYRIVRSRVKPCAGCPAPKATVGAGPARGEVADGSSGVTVVAAAVRGAEGYRTGSVLCCPDETARRTGSGSRGEVAELAPDYYMSSAWRDVLLLRLDREDRVLSWLAPRTGPGREAAMAVRRQVPLPELFEPGSRQTVADALESLEGPGDSASARPVRLGGVEVAADMIAHSQGVLALVGCVGSADSADGAGLSFGDLAERAARELEGALGQPVELQIEEEDEGEDISRMKTDRSLLEAFRRIGRTPPQGFGRKGLRMTLSRLHVERPMHELEPGSYIGLHLSNRDDGDPLQPPPDGHIRSMPLESNPRGRILVSAVSSDVHSYTVVLPEEKGGR